MCVCQCTQPRGANARLEERGCEGHGTGQTLPLAWDRADLADGSRLTGDESRQHLLPSRLVQAGGGGSRGGRDRYRRSCVFSDRRPGLR
jgi:hypothetical protein